MQSVRDVLFKYQKDFANQDGGAILDGRDIGTVICPDADYKFFVIASPEERANRRFKEMKEKGQNVSYDEIFYLGKRYNVVETKGIQEPYLTKNTILIDICKTKSKRQKVLFFNLSLFWGVQHEKKRKNQLC